MIKNYKYLSTSKKIRATVRRLNMNKYLVKLDEVKLLRFFTSTKNNLLK